MKDKMARAAVDALADKLGYKISCDKRGNDMYVGHADAVGVYGLHVRVAQLEENFKALKESARPTCKSCGQKIQDGFRAGDVEAVAAAVRKTDKKR